MRPSLRTMIPVFALVLAACGGAATTTTTTIPTTTAPTESTFPVTLASAAGPATIVAPPSHIAALSATHVEMLFAIGAGDTVFAGDLNSNYPPAADALTKIDAFNLNVEAVIALDPDLVVLSYDPGDAVAALEAVGIPTLLFPTALTIDDTYDQIVTLGAATGRSEEAEALVADLETELKEITADFGGAGTGLRYYYETDPFSFYTPNSSTFIGRVLGLLGMESIADAAPDDFGSGFPQLTPEFIVDADPDVIILAADGEDLSTVAARDGWNTMTAVQVGRVIVVDPDVAGRWGPRIGDLLRAIADGITEMG